jgi:hypothetical protein
MGSSQKSFRSWMRDPLVEENQIRDSDERLRIPAKSAARYD